MSISSDANVSSSSAPTSDPLTEAFLSLPPYLPSISPSLLPHLTTLILASSFSESSLPLPSPVYPPPLKLVSTISQGFGVISSREIEERECIFLDRPLVIWESGSICDHTADELLERLSEKGREIYLSLGKSDEEEGGYGELSETLKIRATNGFNVEIPELDEELILDNKLREEIRQGKAPSHVSMVFPRISRFNHSCLPNLLHSTSFSSLSMSLISSCKIPPSTPLTIEYTSSLLQLTRAERRDLLKRCCSLEGEAQLESDRRRNRIGELVKQIREVGLLGNRRSEVLEMFGEMKKLVDEEGYMGLVEFDDPNVSAAYHAYTRMIAAKKAQSEVQNSEKEI